MQAAEPGMASLHVLPREQSQTLSLVVPVLNEEAAVPLFLGEIEALRLEIGRRFALTVEVLFVDDGSTDATRQVIESYIAPGAGNWVKLVCLSRNFGKEVALAAGLREAQGVAVIPMDVDLQDPPAVVLELIEVWRRTGVAVVQAVRSDRSDDSLLKRVTAGRFYDVMGRISNVQIEPNVGDFQLLSRKAVDALMAYPERVRFTKGLSASIGFKREKVFYKRPVRSTGLSKFNGWRLWNLALDGITSFSTLPLRVWTYVGVLAAVVALTFAAWTVVRTMVFGVVTPGYASLLVTTLFLGGLQLIGIGVVGEYVGRVATEVRNRPMYHVELRKGFEGEERNG
jgi:glycosyltransferase involved in cell wall biosynthesis